MNKWDRLVSVEVRFLTPEGSGLGFDFPDIPQNNPAYPPGGMFLHDVDVHRIDGRKQGEIPPWGPTPPKPCGSEDRALKDQP